MKNPKMKCLQVDYFYYNKDTKEDEIILRKSNSEHKIEDKIEIKFNIKNTINEKVEVFTKNEPKKQNNIINLLLVLVIL